MMMVVEKSVGVVVGVSVVKSCVVDEIVKIIRMMVVVG
jgi:hypothetical protein